MRQEPSYGVVAALAEVIGATRRFAGRVVAAVRAGTEAELYKRCRRKTAVKKLPRGNSKCGLWQEETKAPNVLQ